MSIPSGVITVPVSAIPTGSFGVSSANISITPSLNLIWGANGQTLQSMCAFNSPMVGWVVLPAVDQAGFITPDTHISTTGWSYLITVTWTTFGGTSTTDTGTIQVFSNQSVEYLIATGSTLGPNPPISGTLLGLQVMPAATYAALASPSPTTLYFTY